MVTHDEQVAAQTNRMLYLSEGKISEDKLAQQVTPQQSKESTQE
jgi:ABC-type lipoprotein export system ATPase subunit